MGNNYVHLKKDLTSSVPISNSHGMSLRGRFLKDAAQYGVKSLILNALFFYFQVPLVSKIQFQTTEHIKIYPWINLKNC